LARRSQYDKKSNIEEILGMVITEESSKTVWNRLGAQWMKEGKPSFLAVGSVQYRVIQNAETKKIEFNPVANMGLMGSSSMQGLVK
jgi:hypothetical protein